MPRQLVHKTTAGHVLLTDGIRLAQDRFLLAAMLPPDHGLYQQDSAGCTDPMLVVEALRQTGYYIQHRFYGVPDTHKFILGGVTFGAEDTGLLAAGTSWLPVNLHVTCTPTGPWTRRRLGMRLEVEFSVAGLVCGHGSLLSEAVDPRLYEVVRRRAVPTEPSGPAPSGGRPLPPGDVGRRGPTDVLLSDDGIADGWLLRIDQENPELFDHPVDHVPGMVLLEAFRQAALAATKPATKPTKPATSAPTERRVSLTGLRAEFARYCELDGPARITARPQPGHPVADRTLVHVTVEQAGAEIATGTMELGPDADGSEEANR
ncbi:ScbA/BarX family gamma-butyrolactone biosynthesis protein [Streptomyces sp. NRAIS3]